MTPAEIESVLKEVLPMVRRLAASYESIPACREDLVQTILLEAWHSLPHVQMVRSAPAYVARLAHNCGVDHVALAVRARTSDAVDEALPDLRPGPEVQAIGEQEHERLMAAIRRLPIGYRQVMSLALEGLSHEEIGGITGLGISNVGVRLMRARDTLRRELGGMR